MLEVIQGRAKRLDDIDLPLIGQRIGVGEDELHAVIDVESRGTGFNSKGELIFLFEPHIFQRRLRAIGTKAELARAEKAGLAHRYNLARNRKSYNKNQQSVLKRAYAINPEAALQSCSWGMFQIMGFHHELIGFATAHDMVTAFADDEEEHLEAAVTFIEKNNLDDELRNHDWAGFARGYNGKNYRSNRYDEKLADAYAKWSRIKDTPIPPAIPKEVEAVVLDAAAPGRQSKTEITSILVGGGAAVAVGEKALEVSQKAKGVLDGFLAMGMSGYILLAIIALAAFILWDRRRKRKLAQPGMAILAQNSPVGANQ